MVSTRNRILNLVDYIESTGIVVNIGKNKAQGNKGFFKDKQKLRELTTTRSAEGSSLV